MGSRIDELEQSINDLKTEMGAESSSPLAPTKGKLLSTRFLLLVLLVNADESEGWIL
ncbi:hypothetical protein ACLOJK_000260 [Asimina triloba]